MSSTSKAKVSQRIYREKKSYHRTLVVYRVSPTKVGGTWHLAEQTCWNGHCSCGDRYLNFLNECSSLRDHG